MFSHILVFSYNITTCLSYVFLLTEKVMAQCYFPNTVSSLILNKC